MNEDTEPFGTFLSQNGCHLVNKYLTTRVNSSLIIPGHVARPARNIIHIMETLHFEQGRRKAFFQELNNRTINSSKMIYKLDLLTVRDRHKFGTKVNSFLIDMDLDICIYVRVVVVR